MLEGLPDPERLKVKQARRRRRLGLELYVASGCTVWIIHAAITLKLHDQKERPQCLKILGALGMWLCRHDPICRGCEGIGEELTEKQNFQSQVSNAGRSSNGNGSAQFRSRCAARDLAGGE